MMYVLPLKVVERVDRIWVRCRTQTREGTIPSANVTEVQLERLRQGERVFVVNSDFQAEQDGDLNLDRGRGKKRGKKGKKMS